MEISFKDEGVFAWSRMYEEMGIVRHLDFSKSAWPIVIPQGMTCLKALEKCRELFPCQAPLEWLKDYASEEASECSIIWTEPRQESSRYPGLSVEGFRNLQLSYDEEGLSLLSRILLEWWHFTVMKDHLDKRCITLCPLPRDGQGQCPAVRFDDGKFKIFLVDANDPPINARPEARNLFSVRVQS